MARSWGEACACNVLAFGGRYYDVVSEDGKTITRTQRGRNAQGHPSLKRTPSAGCFAADRAAIGSKFVYQGQYSREGVSGPGAGRNCGNALRRWPIRK